MFDKKLYWERRNNKERPLRGQDPVHPGVFKPGKPGQHMKSIGGRIMLVSRKIARQKDKDRLYTKKGYRSGQKIA